jgi:tartrate dehydrogenase/decarboxylase/D-malate dehydrogenase
VREQVLIDALAAMVVLDPGRFDVIVASNLFGDILSDLAAAVAGSIGIGAQMLEHLGEEEAAAAVLAAVGEMLASDGPRTPDLGGSATTAEVTAALTASFAAR